MARVGVEEREERWRGERVSGSEWRGSDLINAPQDCSQPPSHLPFMVARG